MTGNVAQPAESHGRAKAIVSAIAALVSTLNILAVVAVWLVPRAARLFTAGFVLPLWYFAVVAAVTILVLAVTWRRTLRVPPGVIRILGSSLSSGTLFVLSLLTAVSLLPALAVRHPERTVYVAAAWPEWVCIVAVAVAFVRLELDPPPLTALNREPDPTRTARVLSVISIATFVAAILLSIIGGLPNVHIPLAELYIQPAILLGITVASLFEHNRWAPAGRFSGVRSVTPSRLTLIAVASVFVQLPLAVLVSDADSGITPAFYGILILFAACLIGILGLFLVPDDGPTKRYDGPTKRARRPRGAAPVSNVGKLPQVEIAPVPGWLALPRRFPADGYKNATEWTTGMLPRVSAEIGTGTDEQKHAFARSIVNLANTRSKRGLAALFVLLEEWVGPFLIAGLNFELSQPWQWLPVHNLAAEIASEATASGPEITPLTSFTTTSGLEGRRRIQADRVDYWVAVDGGWAHLSFVDEPQRVASTLPQLDVLASAIFIGNRVVGRRKQPVS